MNRLLLLAIPLALAACSSEQTPQESAEDFASRIGQDGESTAGAGVDPDKPNTVAKAPPANADLTQLQKLGDIGGVDFGPRDGGCTLMVGKNEIIIA